MDPGRSTRDDATLAKDAYMASLDGGATVRQALRRPWRVRSLVTAIQLARAPDRARERYREIQARQRVEKAELRRWRDEQLRNRLARKEHKLGAKMRRRRAAVPGDLRGAVAELERRPPDLPLDEYSHQLLSQHGEDGVTVEIFRRIGVEHRRCVEIGCGANGGNAGVLVAGLDFQALLLDGNADLIEIATDLFGRWPARVQQAWITAESVNGLLAEYGFDRDLDYLGIDLDGIDYWIWDALEVSARLMICEYNAYFGPEAAVTIPYAPDFDRSVRDEARKLRYPKGYFGASIAALESLGRRKGYRLVGTVPGSQNALFVHDDAAAGLPAVSAADAWRRLTKGKGEAPHGELLYSRIEEEGVEAYFGARGAPLVSVARTSAASA